MSSSAASSASGGAATATVTVVEPPPPPPTAALGAAAGAGAPSASAADDEHSLLFEPPKELVLKLKRRVRRVRFTPDTVDNEDLGRKKSKSCCIFHPKNPRGDQDVCDEECVYVYSSGDEGGRDEPDVLARKRPRPSDGDGGGEAVS